MGLLMLEKTQTTAAYPSSPNDFCRLCQYLGRRKKTNGNFAQQFLITCRYLTKLEGRSARNHSLIILQLKFIPVMKMNLHFRFGLTLLTIIWTACSIFAQGITTPRVPSPAASVSQTIGISTINISYSRPSVRGRTIWGELVPYGWNVQNFGFQNSAPWRAGANENTVITLSHDAKVEGQNVPAGSYGLFFTINADDSGEVILSKDYRSWGSFFYDPAHDLFRAPIKIRSHDMTELLTYDFVNLTKNSGELVLNWEKKQFPVKIEFAVDDIVMANAEEQLKNTAGFNWMGYSSAANYALQNNTHLAEAVEWVDKSITMNKNFTNMTIKSALLRKQNKPEEASRTEKEAIDMGSEAEVNTYGYQFLNQNNFDDAIRILTMNTQKHPESANTWDSLGEAYALKGDKENAIINFKKSLSLNPPEGTKANSIKYLKQLGAM
jgi:tetratricopeptide (TPR) repeat protein